MWSSKDHIVRGAYKMISMTSWGKSNVDHKFRLSRKFMFADFCRNMNICCATKDAQVINPRNFSMESLIRSVPFKATNGGAVVNMHSMLKGELPPRVW